MTNYPTVPSIQGAIDVPMGEESILFRSKRFFQVSNGTEHFRGGVESLLIYPPTLDPPFTLLALAPLFTCLKSLLSVSLFLIIGYEIQPNPTQLNSNASANPEPNKGGKVIGPGIGRRS